MNLAAKTSKTFNRIMGRIYEIFRNLAVSFTKPHYNDTLLNTIHIFLNTNYAIQYVLTWNNNVY